MFLQDEGGISKWQDADRKLRLGVLSFLASQDLSNTRLHVWTDVDSKHKLVQDWLGPILAHKDYVGSVSLSTFDPAAEFAKVSPTHGPVLLELYNKDSMLASKSDLFRLALLHNYGGTWVDTDALLIHDFSPLMHEDWAYLGQGDFINNAVLSVSRPRSDFVSANLATVAAHGIKAAESGNVYKFGPSLLGELHETLPHTPGGPGGAGG